MEDPFASVCVFFLPLAQGATAHPQTYAALFVCCIRRCLTCSESGMSCENKKKNKKLFCQDPDWVNLVSLLATSPVKRRPIRKQASQPKL